MQNVYLGLGSNLGDREANLLGALDQVASLPTTSLSARSPIYETPPMGPQDQGAYLNAAVQIQTALSPLDLLASLQQIELQLGRADVNDRRRWGSREIDIDILIFGSQVINHTDLTVPHPGMHKRWFVLKPLSDIAAHLVHPLLGERIADLFEAVEATQPGVVQP